jgi:hypothetical protein
MWPNDPRLQRLVRQHRPEAKFAVESCLLSATPHLSSSNVPPAATSGASGPAAVAYLPSRFHPAAPGEVLVTCPSCGDIPLLKSNVGLASMQDRETRLTCEQATDGEAHLITSFTLQTDKSQPDASLIASSATNPPRVTSTDVPTQLPATHQPSLANALPATSVPTSLEGDEEVHGSCDTPQTHGLSDNGNQKAIRDIEQLDTLGPSNSRVAAPWAHQSRFVRAPKFQSHDTPLPATRAGSLASGEPVNKRKRDGVDEGTSRCITSVRPRANGSVIPARSSHYCPPS